MRARRPIGRRASCARRASAWRRWKGAASSPTGTAARPARRLHARRRCRTSIAPALPSASASTKGASASSRPMSAAASATRASCCPRKSALAWLALKLGHPVRWIEDRREQLTASADCREHHYDITAYADANGRLLALDCEATVDAGAYSAYPFSACLEAGAGRQHSARPLRLAALSLPHLFGRDQQAADPARIAASRAPASASRIEADARRDRRARPGIEPCEVRLRNLVRARADAVRQHHQASISTAATIREALRRAVAAIDLPRCARGRSAASRTDAASASASRVFASRPRTARRLSPAGAFRWCRA